MYARRHTHPPLAVREPGRQQTLPLSMLIQPIALMCVRIMEHAGKQTDTALTPSGLGGGNAAGIPGAKVLGSTQGECPQTHTPVENVSETFIFQFNTYNNILCEYQKPSRTYHSKTHATWSDTSILQSHPHDNMYRADPASSMCRPCHASVHSCHHNRICGRPRTASSSFGPRERRKLDPPAPDARRRWRH